MTQMTTTNLPIWRARPTGYLLLKPVVDSTLVLIMLPLVLPLVAIITLIVMSDGGPAFFAQRRIGRSGRPFILWKLRTMVPDAERALAAHLEQNPSARAEWQRDQKLADDPRVTPFGRFLRASSLDELPQLWNVLSGDMALVGPRPMMPEQESIYPGNSYYRLRPGLTGLWQVSRRGQSSFAARGAFDAVYEHSMSLSVDLQILLRTVKVVFRGTGT